MPAHSSASGTNLHEAKRLKEPVRVASTATITLTAPGATIDSVTMSSGDRFLAKNQSTASQNGIYVWNGAASTATRALDADDAADFTTGFLVYVLSGTVNATTFWYYTTVGAITLGSTSLTFVGVGAGALTDPTTTRGDLIQRGASALARLAIGTVGKFLGTDGTDTLWTNSATYFGATGLTGATTGGRFGGGTVSGAPVSGTWAVNDFVIDNSGKIWGCIGAGTPGTWAQSGGGMSNPMTTNQDLIVAASTPTPGTPVRLAIGANGQVLTITSGVIGWTNPTSGFSNPMTSIGDIITGTTAGAAIRLAIGAGGQVLTVVGGQPGWANPAGGAGGTNNNVASSVYLARTCI